MDERIVNDPYNTCGYVQSYLNIKQNCQHKITVDTQQQKTVHEATTQMFSTKVNEGKNVEIKQDQLATTIVDECTLLGR